METSTVAPPVSKRAKFFSFMSPQSHIPSTGAAANLNLTVKDISQQFTLFVSDNGIAGQGLQIFNDVRFNGLRPLIARKLFTAPASSAASERVFSRAGLIMRPTRSIEAVQSRAVRVVGSSRGATNVTVPVQRRSGP